MTDGLFLLDSPIGPIDALIEAAGHAEETAKQQLIDDFSDDAWDNESTEPTPKVSLLDGAGRAIVALRLVRQADAENFTLVLLTQEEL